MGCTGADAPQQINCFTIRFVQLGKHNSLASKLLATSHQNGDRQVRQMKWRPNGENLDPTSL